MDDGNNYDSDDEMGEDDEVGDEVDMEYGEEDTSGSENTSLDSEVEDADHAHAHLHAEDEEGWQDEEDEDDMDDEDEDEGEGDMEDGDINDDVEDHEITWQVKLHVYSLRPSFFSIIYRMSLGQDWKQKTAKLMIWMKKKFWKVYTV